MEFIDRGNKLIIMDENSVMIWNVLLKRLIKRIDKQEEDEYWNFTLSQSEEFLLLI